MKLPPFLTRHRTRALIRLANDAVEKIKHVVGMANDFSVQDDGWVQLTPLGDFPHPLGMQRVDAEACRQMENTFTKGVAGLGNRFVGLPWYVGHPDVDRKTYANDACYGRIKEVQARADGLYGKVEFGTKGKALIDDKEYAYHSPVWDGTAIAMANSKPVVRPFKLLSCGFTNQPRIPVLPLANDERDQTLSDKESAAGFLIANAIAEGVLNEEDRAVWTENFTADFKGAQLILANAGTSEGAKKGWETRRAGMAAKDPAKVAAKVAARTRKKGNAQDRLNKAADAQDAANKSGDPKEIAAANQERIAAEKAVAKQGRDPVKRNANGMPFKKAATPPPLPKVGTPEREALYRRTAPAAAARVAARTSGYDSSKSADQQGGAESPVFMQ